MLVSINIIVWVIIYMGEGNCEVQISDRETQLITVITYAMQYRAAHVKAV